MTERVSAVTVAPGPRHRLTTLLRWSSVVVTVVGIGVALPLLSRTENPTLVVAVLAYTAVGFVLTGRRPENSLGWVFLASGVLIGLNGLTSPLDNLAATAPEPVPGYAWIGTWIADSTWPITLALLAVAPLLLYPSGHVSHRMRPVLWALVATIICLSVATALQPYFTYGDGNPRRITNPLSPPFMAGVGDAQSSVWFVLGNVVFVLCGVFAVASLVLRTRKARGVERQQLRWFVYAAVLLAMVFVTDFLPDVVPTALSNILMAIAVALIPISCGIAIMKYRLYDLDRVVSRTASYAIVTGLLLATYAVVVTSVSRLLGESSTLAVAMATLTAAALVRPLLSRVQHVVDRRFNREKVDHQRAIDDFAARLRDPLDELAVGHDLVLVTSQTLAPDGARLWIRGSAS